MAAPQRAYGCAFADHQARLDPDDWQFPAFGDLTGYLSWHVTPDRRREDEPRIVGEISARTGSQVLLTGLDHGVESL